jgi:hypothetical protein
MPVMLHAATLNWSLGPISLGMHLADAEKFLQTKSEDVGCRIISMQRGEKTLTATALDAPTELVFSRSKAGVWVLVEMAIEYENSSDVESNLTSLFGRPTRATQSVTKWIKNGKTLALERGSPALLRFKVNGYTCESNADR